jgi:colanic acid/amylovoran biosynthesis protein
MGNIGDQAMLESFLVNTTLPVTLLVQFEDGHEIPAEALDRVSRVVIPDLFGTRPWVRRRVRRTVASLIAQHSTVSVIGADVMDGSCGAVEPAIRFGMLCMSNELGTANRVLGFSWRGTPPAAVEEALMLSQPRTLLCVRDPHSLARLQAAGDYNLLQVADMVFTMNDVDGYHRIIPWLSDQIGRPIVIMNVSGLLAGRGVNTSEYAEIATHLLQRGCSIIILPHVIRSGDDDLPACAELVSQLEPSPHIYFIKELLRPRQVAWLALRASAVLTGRMHLAILSLNQEVPAAVLSTNGKVSGLLDLLGIPELVLDPKPGFAARALKVLDQALDDPSIRTRLSMRLTGVRQLAELNFAGLEPTTRI